MAWQKSRKSSVKLQLYSSKKFSNCHVSFYSIFNYVINIATKLKFTLTGVRIPVGEKYIYFLQKRPDCSWDHLASSGYKGSFSWAKYPDRKVTHSSPSTDRLRTSRAVLLLLSVTSRPLTFIYLCH